MSNNCGCGWSYYYSADMFKVLVIMLFLPFSILLVLVKIFSGGVQWWGIIGALAALFTILHYVEENSTFTTVMLLCALTSWAMWYPKLESPPTPVYTPKVLPIPEETDVIVTMKWGDEQLVVRQVECKRLPIEYGLEVVLTSQPYHGYSQRGCARFSAPGILTVAWYGDPYSKDIWVNAGWTPH